MKITLCGSIKFFDQMMKVGEKLDSLGCDVFIPMPNEDELLDKGLTIENKFNVMRDHFDSIHRSDAILVLNYDKNSIEGYIGTNTLIEIGVAFFLRKKIFILNDLPDLPLKDEVEAMKPIFLKGSIEKIKEYL